MDKKSIVPNGRESWYHDWHYSPAIAAAGFVFVSGCTGARADGSISDNPARQFRQGFENVGQSLEAAGLSFDDVVEMTTYHVGLMTHMDTFCTVKDQFIGEPYAAWTAIGISELAVPGALVEIRVIARGSNT